MGQSGGDGRPLLMEEVGQSLRQRRRCMWSSKMHFSFSACLCFSFSVWPSVLLCQPLDLFVLLVIHQPLSEWLRRRGSGCSPKRTMTPLSSIRDGKRRPMRRPFSRCVNVFRLCFIEPFNWSVACCPLAISHEQHWNWLAADCVFILTRDLTGAAAASSAPLWPCTAEEFAARPQWVHRLAIHHQQPSLCTEMVKISLDPLIRPSIKSSNSVTI